MAARHGIETIDEGAVDEAHAVVLESTEGRGADAVIDAVGMEAHGSSLDAVLQATKLQLDRTHALWQCMRSVRRGGTLSVVGVYAGPVHLFPLGDLFDLGVTLRMGQANVRRWVPELLPLLEGDADPLGVDDLATHDLPLDTAPQAYRMFQRKEHGCIKVVLRPGLRAA
jgi:threonine dehydrogenase-like Zn-dependent dehydrogenase